MATVCIAQHHTQLHITSSMTCLQALYTLLALHAPLLQNNTIVSLVIPFTNNSSDSDVTFVQSAGTSTCYSQHCLSPVCILHV